MKRVSSAPALDSQPTYSLNTIWLEKQIWFVKQLPLRTQEQGNYLIPLYCEMYSVILIYHVVL